MTSRKLRYLAISAIAVSMLVGCSSSQPTPQTAAPQPEASADAAVVQYLTSIRERVEADAPGVEIPDVPIIEPLGYLEQPARVVECLSERGFEARVAGPANAPSVRAEYPPEQFQTYALALYECQASYPVQTAATPVNAETVATFYDFLVDETVPCLEELGYDVPPAPARQTFIDQFVAGEPTWTPMDVVLPDGEQAWNEAFDACPQNPWM